MPCCKVTRVIEEYDLRLGQSEHETVSDYLVHLWHDEESGYRAIADVLNRRLLRKASIRAGRQVTDPQIESEYDTLQGEDEEAAREVRAALDSAGVDIATLERNFLSHMALQRHFQNCLSLEPPERESNEDWQEEGVAFLKDQFQGRIQKICRSLTLNDIVPDAEAADIQLSIDLRCPECPTRTSIERAIERGYVCEAHATSEE